MTACITLGQQTFDGLGRQRKVEVAGRSTHYHYQPGQLPPAANTLADGKRVTFAYQPHLGNALCSTTVEDMAPQTVAYHPTLGVPITASGALGSQEWQFTASGQPQRDTWKVDGQEHSTAWRHSLDGLLLGFTDANGVEHQRLYDAFGRLSELRVGEIRSTFTYDAFSRLASLTSADQGSGRQLFKQLTYDSMGREASSTFTITGVGAQRIATQTLAYSDLDQVVLRTWDDGQQQGQERFEYDVRGRLVRYTANAAAAPLDPFGNAILEQRFTFTSTDGLLQVTSLFADASQDLASFSYAEHDPTQVVSVSHSHASWPARIDLSYDACGRVIADSLGRSLSWSALDRLQRVQIDDHACDYAYDPSGNLCDRRLDDSLYRSFFSGGQLTHEQQGAACLEMVGDGSNLFALCKVAEGVRQTLLLGSDGQGSIRLEVGEQVRSRRYTAHGATSHDDDATFGYTGARREPLTGWYIPAGYRPYDPLLMCFLCPDNESPFGRGGINAYSYCGGDPVNRIDPDGHSWVTWAVAGAGLAIGIASTVASLGSLAPVISALLAGGALTSSAALAVSSAALNVMSLSTGAAAMALEASGKNQQAAKILGWISLGSGIASVVTGMAASASKGAGHGARFARRAGATKSRDTGMTRPLAWKGQSEVLYAEKLGQNDVAMHHNLWGKGIQAFETHGSSSGQLMNTAGQMDDPARIALKEIAPRLTGVSQDTPLVLLACSGGKSGAAQKLADVLQRPVYGYDKTIWVNQARWMQHLDVSPTDSSIPMQQISLARRLLGAKGPFSWYPDREIATGRLYFPQR
ncbi:RHS repeat domain-containing protein [Pseudomonas putida]